MCFCKHYTNQNLYVSNDEGITDDVIENVKQHVVSK